MIAGRPDSIKSKLVVFRLRIGDDLAGEGDISPHPSPGCFLTDKE